jgi:hypothetical protein
MRRSKIQHHAQVWIDFAAEDHLWVHQETERRAYLLWLAEGCPEGNSLSDWLRAEHETLMQFFLAYEQRIPTRWISRPERIGKAIRSKPGTAILTTPANIGAGNPDVKTTTPVHRL